MSNWTITDSNARADCYNILLFSGNKRCISDPVIEEKEGEKPKYNTKCAKVSACGVAREDSPEPHWYTWYILA